MRRPSAWLVVVPLMVAGTEVAHALAYRLVYPQASVRWQALATTGHAYLAWLPPASGVAGALCLAGLVGGVVESAQRRPSRAVPAWLFGLLPLAGFTFQEFLERWVALGGFPWWMVQQPTFRVGLLLQLPFALVSFVVARLLLRATRRVGSGLRATRPCPVVGELPSARPRVVVDVLRPSALAARHAGRGPPPARVPLLSF